MKFKYRKLQKRAKLIGKAGSGMIWLQNEEEECIHDCYEESHIHHGRFFSLKSFHPAATRITGYFQGADSKRWIKVFGGCGYPDGEYGWKETLDEILTLERQSNRSTV